MTNIYLSNGSVVNVRGIQNADGKIAEIAGREMTESEWNEYCRICRMMSLLRVYTANRFDLWSLTSE